MKTESHEHKSMPRSHGRKVAASPSLRERWNCGGRGRRPVEWSGELLAWLSECLGALILFLPEDLGGNPAPVGPRLMQRAVKAPRLPPFIWERVRFPRIPHSSLFSFASTSHIMASPRMFSLPLITFRTTDDVQRSSALRSPICLRSTTPSCWQA